MLKTAALIVAAGRGTRARGPGRGPGPKQYAAIGGVPVLAQALRPFLAHPDIAFVAVAIARGDEALYRAAVAGLASDKLLSPIGGGATRQASVGNGLRALSAHLPDGVLIHDAARPFVTRDVIDRVLGALAQWPGAIAALPLADTLKKAGPGGLIAATVDRAGLWRAQTPQGFRFADILAAHERARAAGLEDMTDDAAIAEWAGLPVALVLGSVANAKLTTPEDFAMAERAAGGPDVRVGQGFDVHRLVAGDHVWLCGVRIAHTQGLEGHSDADVALHALTDALLGAIGAGDIGQHFPDSDPHWRGAASGIFVGEALRLVRAHGGTIRNVDVTLLCEAPRIAPHRDAMRRRIGELLELEEARVSVKATTTEGLGFAGRREGIAAVATASVVLR
ncbi:MAG TPA: bifunctional 2-C-methyl-D-erythritol 4-phosphate cytidylyltransferase/2-C-methyl-D-erythritol 2,4-cyclodiphosphate synthase [Hyphomicrobiaceae bacterium]|nr:bifunctional 2-C-methyl-D-erythritol 4-phosphate cytidylyltransferase/2-C-methyl-D-erythritol 2,4-cyclodiphosphate synthase [Hyphomicrobiaceae bacterium]